MHKKLKLGFIPGLAADRLAADWDGTLQTLAGHGYQGIELSAGILEQSGMTVEAARESLARHGIDPVSWFSNWGEYRDRGEEIMAKAKTLGCRHMIWGWAPANDRDRMREVFPAMRQAAEGVRAAGMTLLYHNHDHEFLSRDEAGRTAYDWLMEHFRADLLQCELDIGWVAYGGLDIVETIGRYAGRCPILHMRDIRDPATRGEFIEVGEGVLDLKAALEAGLAVGGSEWAIVEHTKPLKAPPLEGLATAARNLLETGLF